jgi:hypothetical protein
MAARIAASARRNAAFSDCGSLAADAGSAAGAHGILGLPVMGSNNGKKNELEIDVTV